MNLPRKILFYSDLALLFKIFIVFLGISFFHHQRISRIFTNLPKSLEGLAQRDISREKILRYVNLFIFFHRKFGIRDTCFSRSILLCNMLRWAGIDIKVNFGVGRSETGFVGHCWLSDDFDRASDYKIILSCP